MAVLRQKRIFPSADGTLMVRLPSSSAPPPLTMKRVPVRAFSGLPPSAGGLKCWITPCSSPCWRILRIDFCQCERLFVGDQSSIGRVCPVDAVLPSRLPKHLVATKKSQVYSHIASSLNIGPMRRRTNIRHDRHPYRSCDSDQCSVTSSIYTGKIRHVVTVLSLAIGPSRTLRQTEMYPILGRNS